jgi:hypothetical protein
MSVWPVPKENFSRALSNKTRRGPNYCLDGADYEKPPAVPSGKALVVMKLVLPDRSR